MNRAADSSNRAADSSNPGVELRVDLLEDNLVRAKADCAVVPLFDDERPLRGGAGLADWRLCGALGRLALEGHCRADSADWVLLPSGGRLGAPRLLVRGLGSRKALKPESLRHFAKGAAEHAFDLRAARIAMDLGSAARVLPPEVAALHVFAGFRDALAVRKGVLDLLLCVGSEDVLRWRMAVERASARQPRVAAGLRLLFPSAGHSAGAAAGARQSADFPQTHRAH